MVVRDEPAGGARLDCMLDARCLAFWDRATGVLKGRSLPRCQRPHPYRPPVFAVWSLKMKTNVGWCQQHCGRLRMLFVSSNFGAVAMRTGHE